MPIYVRQCLHGHKKDRYYARSSLLGIQTELCEECGEGLGLGVSFGRGLTWFEEGRGRWIENMGDDPVYITSHEQHKREMKKRGLEWVTPKRGMPGSW